MDNCPEKWLIKGLFQPEQVFDNACYVCYDDSTNLNKESGGFMNNYLFTVLLKTKRFYKIERYCVSDYCIDDAQYKLMKLYKHTNKKLVNIISVKDLDNIRPLYIFSIHKQNKSNEN